MQNNHGKAKTLERLSYAALNDEELAMLRKTEEEINASHGEHVFLLALKKDGK